MIPFRSLSLGFDDITNEWTHLYSILDVFLSYLCIGRDEKVAKMINDLIELDSSRRIAVEVLGYVPTKNPETLTTSLKKLFHLPDVRLIKIVTDKEGSYERLECIAFKSRKYPHLIFKLSKPSSTTSNYVTLTIDGVNPFIKECSVLLDVNLSYLSNPDFAKAVLKLISESEEYFKKLEEIAKKIVRTISSSMLKLSFFAENPIRISTKPLTFNITMLMLYDLRKCFSKTIEGDLKMIIGGKTFTYDEFESFLKKAKRDENVTL